MDGVLRAVGQTIAALGGPAWVVLPDGTVFGGNPAASAIFGRAEGWIAGKTTSDLAMPEDLPRLRKALENASVAAPGRFRFYGAFRHRDGGRRCLDCLLSPVRDQAATVAILVQVLSEARHDEAGPQDEIVPQVEPGDGMTLQQHYAILQHASKLARSALWYFDPAFRKMWASDQYYALLGHAPQAFAIDSDWVRAHLHPDDRDAAIDAMDALVAGRLETLQLDYRLRCKDGDYRWFEVKGRKLIREGQGLPPVICGSLTEITRRKDNETRVETALAAARSARTEAATAAELLSIASEHSGVLSWYFDTAEERFVWNERFEALTGHAEMTTGARLETVLNLVHPDDVASAGAHLRDLAEGHVDVARLEYRFRHKQGHWLWFSSAAKYIRRDDQALPPLVFGCTFDIGHIKEYDEKLAVALEQAQAAYEVAEAARRDAQNYADMMDAASESSEIVPWYIIPERDERCIGGHLRRMLGYEDGPPLSMEQFRELMDPEKQAELIASFEALVEGRVDHLSHDYRLRRADGGWCWVMSKAKLIDRSAQGLPNILCGTITNITERKENEEQLSRALAAAEHARSQAKSTADMLRIAAQCGEVCVWSLSVDGRDTWMSEDGYRLMGYDPGEFVPDHDGWRGLIHPDDRSEAVCAMEAVIAGTADVYDLEHRLRHKDGRYHWYRAVARKLDRSAEGRPPLIAGADVCIDSLKDTERSLSEALARIEESRNEMREREEMLRISGLYGRIGYFTVCSGDGEGWAPDETYRLLGYEPGEFPSSHSGWRNLIHPDDLAAASEAMEPARRGEKEIYEHQHRLRHKDGSYHWYRGVAHRIDRSDRGLPELIAGAIISIDDAKENERRLAEAAALARRARDRLNTLADNVPDALFEYRHDAEGNISFPYFSEKLPDIAGVPRELVEADGRNVFANIHPDDLEPFLTKIEESRQSLTPFKTNCRVLHPEMGLRWLFASTLPFAQADGSVIWFGNLMDVTDQMEAEARVAAAAAAVRRAHRRLNTLTDNAPVALYEFRFLPDGTVDVPYFSAKLPKIMGVTREEVEANGAAFGRHVPEDELAAIWQKMWDACRELVPVTFTHPLNHPDKGLRWILSSARPRAQADGSVIFYSSLVDVTEQKAAEERAAAAAEQVRRAHERLSSVANIVPVGLYEYRRRPDGGVEFTFTSGRFNELVGFSRSEILNCGERAFERIHPDDMARVAASLQHSGETLAPWKLRFRLRHPSRGEIWLAGAATPRRDDDGSLIWTGALHDVTPDVQREADLRQAHRLAERMRAEKERQAMHDVLTGLPNRRFFDQIMQRRFAQAWTGPRDCVLIRLDLDHFKYVNDTLGHAAGDRVLIRVADVLRESIRVGDLAARIGGDEFTIILGPSATALHAQEIVERIQTRLEKPLLYDGRQCRFGASFGVAHVDDITEIGNELQLFADAALYRAKEAGRNRVEFFTTDLHQNILNDRRIAGEIHEGLDNGEFVPFFQPQISSADGSLVGAEALLRWRHPVKGLLAPNAFMHVAEQLRIVPEIDRIVMEKTRAALQRWRDRGLVVPKISFNVSSGRMHDPDVVSAARSMRDGKTKVTFELLESILVEEESDAFRFHLQMIREAGIDIEIDDFGSGHASIIGLMEIAPSTLKIDRRIVAPVADDVRSRNLVRAIVEIAETLGISTVAEGVETEAQADILRAIGCDVLQGYLFSKPLSEEDFLHYALGAARRIA